jgi:hypothetical protein
MSKLKLNSKKMIKNLLIVVAIVIVLGVGGVGFLFYQPDETNSSNSENKQDFTIQQLDKFKADIDEIAKPIFDPNWKWSKSEYKQVMKLLSEKDSLLSFIVVDEVSKENLRTAQNYSKNNRARLIAIYNAAITKKANDLIASTNFDFELARNLLNEIDSSKIDYLNKETLEKHRNVSFRVYQAKEIIRGNTLPKGVNAITDANGNAITDIKMASSQVSDTMQSILKNNDYNFLTSDQKCHLKEWNNLLIVRKHKDNIEEMIGWIVAREGGKTKRAGEIRKFIEKGECTN